MTLLHIADSVNEKNTRGRLKSAVEKAVSRKAILILDSLNNIKGYRQAPINGMFSRQACIGIADDV